MGYSSSTMEPELTIICMDTSDWMLGSQRFLDQAKAVKDFCAKQLNAHPENCVGLLSTGEIGIGVLLRPTGRLEKIVSRIDGLKPLGGDADLIFSIYYAEVAWGHYRNKFEHLKKKIIAFAGGPLFQFENDYRNLGMEFKEKGIAVDIVKFGTKGGSKKRFTKVLIDAVNNNGNSRLIDVPEGYSLSDYLSRSSILHLDKEVESVLGALHGISKKGEKRNRDFLEGKNNLVAC